MAKITRYNCAYLQVIPDPLFWREMTPGVWLKQAKDLKEQIERHCDNVSSIEVCADTDDLCEHCGAHWTEGDSPHNGGCCEKDADVMEKEVT